MNVVERHLVAHNGVPDSCEDAIVVTSHFAAVIDGATAKLQPQTERETPGHVAARLLAVAIETLSPGASAREAVDHLTRALVDYASPGVDSPDERPSAAVSIYSAMRRELWRIGDCQFMIDGVLFSTSKTIDRIAADARAAFAEACLLSGASVADLQVVDRGREFIMPLLMAQLAFQNAPAAGDLGYGAIDGTRVPDEFVEIYPVNRHASSIVIASDGYPSLLPTLEESETALASLLRSDPLLIRGPKATKGRMVGDASFDDRAYLSLSA